MLVEEREFPDFQREVSRRDDIEHVFLVTDSEENFALMRRAFGSKIVCVQLYRSYLENFRLNTPAALEHGGAE